MDAKRCSSCNKSLALSDFGSDRNRPDRLSIYCRGCRHEAYLQRKGAGKVYGNFTPKQCVHCRRMYNPTGPRQRFCSKSCRWLAVQNLKTCKGCGEVYRTRKPNDKFCTRTCYLQNGCVGRYQTADGYIRVTVPKGTSGADCNNRMLEHRYVMQVHLGRPLTSNETIHHVNGKKSDNRIENLQLRKGRHGKGVALTCLDCGSSNIAPHHL